MSKEETNQQIAQLAAVIAAYIKSTAELDQQRAKEAKELDEKRAKAAEAREKAAEAREKAAEAREKAAEAREKAAEKRAVEAEKRDKAAEKRAVEAEKRDKAAEKRSKAAAKDTQELKNTVEGLAEKVDKVTMQVDKVTMQMKETNRRYGSTARNTGRVTEEKFFRALESQKRVGNTTFESIEHNIRCEDGKPNGRSAELDIIMHNGTYSLIIEVKYLCHLNDVEKFEEKMHTAYAYISKKFNNRKLLFGMAANTFNEDAVDYAHEHGMITFHPDGQKVRTDIPAHTLLHPNTSV